MAENKGGAQGVGKGRRMPVQQSVDIGAPIETVYNQWTQFEDWPSFMHRVTRVTQEDDCTVSVATKIWAKTKEFTANIETQWPNERIKWSVSQGMTHTGVVTFHELAPNLTRVLLSFDVEPGSLIEKAARGMRHVKRAARADLHRFKALIEMAGLETGAWRGRIEDGEVVEEHDPSYDEEREYADVESLVEPADEEDEDEEAADDEDEDEEGQDDEPEDDEEEPKAQRSRRQRRNPAAAPVHHRTGGAVRLGAEARRRAVGDQQSARRRASAARRPARSRAARHLSHEAVHAAGHVAAGVWPTARQVQELTGSQRSRGRARDHTLSGEALERDGGDRRRTDQARKPGRVRDPPARAEGHAEQG